MIWQNGLQFDTNGNLLVSGAGSAGGASPTFASVVSDAPATSKNDYAPTGYIAGTTNSLKLTPSSDLTITGIVAAPDGWVVAIDNDSTTATITFTDQDAASSNANQFALPGQVAAMLGPRASTSMKYDSALSKWRFLS